jgi:hypothetical protein
VGGTVISVLVEKEEKEAPRRVFLATSVFV